MAALTHHITVTITDKDFVKDPLAIRTVVEKFVKAVPAAATYAFHGRHEGDKVSVDLVAPTDLSFERLAKLVEAQFDVPFHKIFVDLVVTNTN